MMHRDRKWLDFLRTLPCMLQVDGVCTGDRNSSVPCHSNQQRHGRGASFKSEDLFAVPGCNECHAWYDSGAANREVRHDTFQFALERLWRYLFERGIGEWRPKDSRVDQN
jgi:hypothetical protein